MSRYSFLLPHLLPPPPEVTRAHTITFPAASRLDSPRKVGSANQTNKPNPRKSAATWDVRANCPLQGQTRGTEGEEREHMQRSHLVNKWGRDDERKESVFHGSLTHSQAELPHHARWSPRLNFWKLPPREGGRGEEEGEKNLSAVTPPSFYFIYELQGKMPLYIINSLLLLWLWLPPRRAADVGGGVITF